MFCARAHSLWRFVDDGEKQRLGEEEPKKWEDIKSWGLAVKGDVGKKNELLIVYF